MIIVGDIHRKNKKYNKEIVDYFFNWLLTIVKTNETIVLLGDVFDKSLMAGHVIKHMMDIFSKFYKVIIVEGNHDKSKPHKSLLEPLNYLDNVNILSEKTNLEIENYCHIKMI